MGSSIDTPFGAPMGGGVVFTVFEDKASADASMPEMRSIWNDVMGRLTVPPKSENFDNVETLGE